MESSVYPIYSINYFSNGSKSYAKEDIKIFCEEKIFSVYLHPERFQISPNAEDALALTIYLTSKVSKWSK